MLYKLHAPVWPGIQCDDDRLDYKNPESQSFAVTARFVDPFMREDAVANGKRQIERG